ncbi:MAG TPA: efflux RND transporter periplasmic adaptor subunit [Verrucomicrobiae bacterium]|jgi:HlyD family secretion protein|nr:efflux RND transporter periplasmic adaptor subunit [Verrucomicrobiae bacterium]
MSVEKLKDLRIQPEQKRRRQRPFWIIVLVVLTVVLAALFFARPWSPEKTRRMKDAANLMTNAAPDDTSAADSPAASTNAPVEARDDTVLTVSGYIINRERIEISPRFLGVVKWIGVKKGDAVTNGQIVVLLDDTEYQARLAQAEGQLANAKAMMGKDELSYQRVHQLATTDIESKQAEDDARLLLEADRAGVKAAEGAAEVARTYVDWCTIRSPINGVVMEKLVNPNELVMPQSFGGTRGPSTALLAVADPKDLQVEIDVNEADLSKISLGQKCRVSPEAYPDKTYGGVVAEIAPEADRAKGTLQIKVQILAPDHFLTPELSAKVDFLKQ